MKVSDVIFGIALGLAAVFALFLAYVVGLSDGYRPCAKVNCEQRVAAPR